MLINTNANVSANRQALAVTRTIVGIFATDYNDGDVMQRDAVPSVGIHHELAPRDKNYGKNFRKNGRCRVIKPATVAG